MTPTRSQTFAVAVDLTLRHEGGFQADPNDRGNWTTGKVGEGELRGTNMGISSMRYPQEDIRGMTRDRAMALYHADFWLAVRGDELPVAIAPGVFDCAVNSGPGRAVQLLQQVLGVAQDGKLGPVTLAAAARAAELPLAVRYAAARLQFCGGLSNWTRYGRSWTARTMDHLKLAAQIARPSSSPGVAA